MELTAKQAAQRLGVSKDWVHRMARSGALAGSRKIGQFWVIPEEALAGVTVPGPGRPRKQSRGRRTRKGNRHEWQHGRSKQANKQRGAVIYTRVSTEEQAENGTSLAGSCDACRQKALALGLPIVAEYEDAGVSGGFLPRARHAGRRSPTSGRAGPTR